MSADHSCSVAATCSATLSRGRAVNVPNKKAESLFHRFLLFFGKDRAAENVMGQYRFVAEHNCALNEKKATNLGKVVCSDCCHV